MKGVLVVRGFGTTRETFKTKDIQNESILNQRLLDTDIMSDEKAVFKEKRLHYFLEDGKPTYTLVVDKV